MIALAQETEGVVLSVIAQPRARRNAILGERGGALRVAVAVPPEKGKANDAIQQFLAESLGCKRAQVNLLGGTSSRQKRFLICGLPLEELKVRLESALTEFESSRARHRA
jgi:uncharacterized protein